MTLQTNARGLLSGLLLGLVGSACSEGTRSPATTRDLPSDSGAPGPEALPNAPSATEVLYLSGRGTDNAVEWDFMINAGRNAGAWSTIPVPSNWEFHGFGDFQYGHNPSTEIGSYRRSFDVPATWSGRRIFITLEGSMTDTEVSVNGVSAGPVHRGGFYHFKHELTSLVQVGAENQLDIVVAKQSANASVNAAEREADYWTFGGIFRPVYLEAFPPQFIERHAVNALANGELTVDVFVQNLGEVAEVTGQVSDAGMPLGAPFSSTLEAGASATRLSASLPGVRAWSAESPNLYAIELRLRTASGAEHVVSGTFGFRTVEVRAGDGIYVNGSKVMLRGANRHSFWPESGRALNERISREDLELMKDMNMNAVRMSHYPPDKHFLDAADELGMYVLDELAGWQSPPYDEAVGAPLVREMVTFNVNHPSILFWDNGNEGGWNTFLDDDFAQWDPQARTVLHPWANFGGINTDHYENYASHSSILAGNTIFLPTEFLHGLYDGGAGAGLEDYWARVTESPIGAGGFLWALVDEGVRRSPNWVDVVGNAAPDGIVGPYREKEGSFYTIRQLWSPVQISLAAIPVDFTGALQVENRFDFTDLDTVTFRWRLANFDFDARTSGHVVLAEGTAQTGSIGPRQNGSLQLSLPSDWSNAHGLLLDANDASGRLIGTWSWMLETPTNMRQQLVSEQSPAAAVADDSALVTDAGTATNPDAAAPPSGRITVSAAGTEYTFDASTGQLSAVRVAGEDFSFRNGPALSTGTSTLTTLTGAQTGNDYTLTARYTGDLEEVVWRVLGNGWLELSYRYALQGEFDFHGIDFNYPEVLVNSVQWLGRGPHRVWKNRIKGPWFDVWTRDKNDAITGQLWDYPEFKGYFADPYWLRLLTAEGTLEVVIDSPGIFLRLYTPKDGVAPQTTAMRFPRGDISFLHGIAPIGDKFLQPAVLGPQSQPNSLAGEPIEGRLYFRFLPP